MSNPNSPASLDRSRRCVVVFVLGGVTQSEMRCAYEVSNKLNHDVFVGELREPFAQFC